MLLTNDLQTELALKARDDSKALAELVANYSGSVWGVIHQKMCNRSQEDKEDMYQDIVFHLCNSIGSFKGKSSFFSWFRRLQLNKIADYYRRNGRNRVFLMDNPDDIGDELTVEPEWYNAYDEYKGLLPKRYHNHFDAIYDIAINGYTLSEEAEKHDKSYEAIRSQCRRGKVALIEDLEKREATY